MDAKRVTLTLLCLTVLTLVDIAQSAARRQASRVERRHGDHGVEKRSNKDKDSNDKGHNDNDKDNGHKQNSQAKNPVKYDDDNTKDKDKGVLEGGALRGKRQSYSIVYGSGLPGQTISPNCTNCVTQTAFYTFFNGGTVKPPTTTTTTTTTPAPTQPLVALTPRTTTRLPTTTPTPAPAPPTAPAGPAAPAGPPKEGGPCSNPNQLPMGCKSCYEEFKCISGLLTASPCEQNQLCITDTCIDADECPA